MGFDWFDLETSWKVLPFKASFSALELEKVFLGDEQVVVAWIMERLLFCFCLCFGGIALGNSFAVPIVNANASMTDPSSENLTTTL